MKICRDTVSIRAAVELARTSEHRAPSLAIGVRSGWVRSGADADVRRAGRGIAFVPTMGALHAGHVSLIEAAKRNGGFVVVSIFVNPTQFGPKEDFTRYPRDESADLHICERAGVDAVFVPTVADMYRPEATTTIHVARLSDTLCGSHRPGHFDGVATVVAKLLNIVQPDAAYFGQKDAQQLAIIRRMVRDLDFPTEIIGCPTVREPDGLAMSSRNKYLTSSQREQALNLSKALFTARERIDYGKRDAAALINEMTAIVSNASEATIDYISVVDTQTLQPVTRIDAPVLIALAVWIGTTRLIDNVTVDPGRVSP